MQSVPLSIGTPDEIRGRESELDAVFIRDSYEFGKFSLTLTGRPGMSLTSISPKPVSASNRSRLL